MQMRGGSSKGAYFFADDLPSDPTERADLLLCLLGSPDERQIDGIGGGHPLTSKVAVISPSTDPEVDVDYLFLQIVPDRPVVTDAQTCGNLLAGVGPFAIERGLIPAGPETTDVRIRIMNPTVGQAVARVRTPAGQVSYEGNALMAGTPFPAAPVEISFAGNGQTVFPTGLLVDVVDGVEVTCVDAGMPVVLVTADALGLEGTESQAALEADMRVVARVKKIRLAAGQAMGLGDVTSLTVPKISIVSPPGQGGTLATRTFIPHRVHAAIGVLGAVSVAIAAVAQGTVASRWAPDPGLPVRIEHLIGLFDVCIELDEEGTKTALRSSTVIRTARKIADGLVWPRSGKALA